jgi:hypothetical protein
MADAWEKSIINVHTTTLEVEEPRLPMVATTGKSPVARQVPPSAVARGMGTSYKTYYQCQRHLQKTFSTDVASPEVEAQAEAVNSPAIHPLMWPLLRWRPRLKLPHNPEWSPIHPQDNSEDPEMII